MRTVSGCTFNPGDRIVNRIAYGPCNFAERGVFDPPKDRDAALSVLRETVADDALIDDLGRLGIAYVPFFPLGGFTPPQSSTLTDAAVKLGVTPMQVAIAWLLRRAPNILQIPGTWSVAHLWENLAAVQLTLPPQISAELDAITAGVVAMEH